jgi:Zn finger protein HypA/HybF involved in hydrogenase expression
MSIKVASELVKLAKSLVAIETDPRYWDCECEDKYIHPKSDKKCKKCGAHQDDMPDSRVDEVKNKSLHMAKSLVSVSFKH